MNDELKVRVSLDTSQARSELTSLNQDAERAAGGVGGRLRDRVKQGLGIVGFGGLGAEAQSVLRGPTSSGISDVVGEALGGYGRQIEQFFLGDLGMEARAASQARESAIQTFGMMAGAQNQIPPGAKAYMTSLQRLNMDQERGRMLFETNDDFRPVKLEDIINRVMQGLGKLLDNAVAALAEKLNPF